MSALASVGIFGYGELEPLPSNLLELLCQAQSAVRRLMRGAVDEIYISGNHLLVDLDRLSSETAAAELFEEVAPPEQVRIRRLMQSATMFLENHNVNDGFVKSVVSQLDSVSFVSAV